MHSDSRPASRPLSFEWSCSISRCASMGSQEYISSWFSVTLFHITSMPSTWIALLNNNVVYLLIVLTDNGLTRPSRAHVTIYPLHKHVFHRMPPTVPPCTTRTALHNPVCFSAEVAEKDNFSNSPSSPRVHLWYYCWH